MEITYDSKAWILKRKNDEALFVRDRKPRMVNFEDLGLEKNELMREYLDNCFVSRIYVVYEGRNAWRNTWKTRYLKELSIHLRLNKAVQHAETWRVQGSRWTIVRTACCVFASGKYSLLVTEINKHTPLSSYALDENRTHRLSLHELALFFRPHAADTVIRHVKVRKRFKPWDGVLLEYQSKREGRGRLGMETARRSPRLPALSSLVYYEAC